VQVEPAYVEAHLVPAQSARDDPPAAFAQERQPVAQQGPGNDIEGDVDTLRGGGADLAGDVPRPVDDRMRAGLAYRIDLVPAADGKHFRAACAGDLGQREADTAGCSRDQHGLALLQAASLDHAQCGAVGGRQRRQLIVRERRLGHIVEAFDGRGNVLGVTAVALASHQSHGIRVGTFTVVGRRVDDDPAADEAFVPAGAHCHHPAGHVGALDAREVDRASPTRQSRRVPRTAVGARTGPQIGVVESYRAHLDQCLPPPWLGNGHLHQFEYFRSPVFRDPHGAHGLGDAHVEPPLRYTDL
jgi:hypothetical protein